MPRNQFMTTKAYFKTLTLLHAAMVTGLTLFSGIVWVQLHFNFNTHSERSLLSIPSNTDDIFYYVAFALVGASIVAAFFLFRTRVAQIREKPTLFAILSDYRNAVLLRNALLEGPGLFSVIASLVTGDERLLAMSGLVILMFLVWWPMRTKIIEDLRLEGEARLQDPDAIID
jgi:H+/Cl- antiporter ClcA